MLILDKHEPALVLTAWLTGDNNGPTFTTAPVAKIVTFAEVLRSATERTSAFKRKVGAKVNANSERPDPAAGK